MRLREGTSTLGLWLPLALASLVQCVIGIGGKPPPRSEILRGWALPELAAAIKKDEDAAQMDALGDWIEQIEERFGK